MNAASVLIASRPSLRRLLILAVLAGIGLPGARVPAQTYVTPKLGGGQATADMVHIDLYYNSTANVFHSWVDDSYGVPQLRALEPGLAFDPQAPYAVLEGKAYNAQYGWNPGGFFGIPPGAAIWIERQDASPGLETYDGMGRDGTYAPILGTTASPGRWKWSGSMVHNTYAVAQPAHSRWFAEYRIYFGDATTGSRAAFSQYADTVVRLEWTAVLAEAPRTLRFGASAPDAGSPLAWVNADQFTTNAGWVINLNATNTGASAGAEVFEAALATLALPATEGNGGPVPGSAAPGSRLELQVLSLTGPAGGELSLTEAHEELPRFRIPAGESAGTHRLALSESAGAPASDPFGHIQRRRLRVNLPGLYTLGVRVVDTSTNGPAGGPLHAPSPAYHLHLQAGFTVNSLQRQGSTVTVVFGGEPGWAFSLERSAAPSSGKGWAPVAGPLSGTNQLQSLADPAAPEETAFYRLRRER